MRLPSAIAFSVMALTAGPVSAAVTVYTTPSAVQPDQQVMAVQSQMPANIVFGRTNNSNMSVTFQSLNSELLQTNSSGQASFSTADSSLDALAFYLTSPLLGFTSVEFNLFNATNSTTSVSLAFSDGTTGSYALNPNGQNFFGAIGTAGTIITRVQFDTNGSGVADLRQVRLGGITSISAVPEPSVWAMMLIGFALVGGTARFRRRHAVAVHA